VARVSWVFSPWPSGFYAWALARAGTTAPIRAVEDQVSRPTSALGLAGFLLDQAAALAAAPADDPRFGLLHYADAPAVSRRGLAEAVLAAAGGGPPVLGVRSADFAEPARRPLRSTLDTTRLEHVFGVPPRDWRAELAATVARGGR
jgi:dTDP-4-dehydrorhamnose reductase